jgi:small-conductance mechanosensitive channel
MDNIFSEIALPFAVAVSSSAALLVLRALGLRFFRRWAEKTETRLDNIFLASLRIPSVYWCVALGLHFGVDMSDLPERQIAFVSRGIEILIVLSATVAVAGMAGAVFSDYIRRSNLPIPGTGLAHGLIKGTILVVGFLVILSILGISITPIITAMGIGGLAVALALQDTLSNLFAGIHVLIEKPIRIGDFIRLETGQEGYVEDITWRTTRIRMLPNNMVIIPNSKVTQTILTNYCLPEKRMSVLIPVSVSYSADPDVVERVLVDEATAAVGTVPGLLGEPAPFVRFIPGFGASSLDFTLICQVGEFVDQYIVQHELRKRILTRFRDEGIEIPFPHRTVYLKEMDGSERR